MFHSSRRGDEKFSKLTIPYKSEIDIWFIGVRFTDRWSTKIKAKRAIISHKLPDSDEITEIEPFLY